jgi:hypothetical protein
MAKMSTTDLLDAFKEMTLLELSDFVKQFEEEFDVTAAAPVAVAAPGAPAGGEEAAAEEQTSFDVVLMSAAPQRPERTTAQCPVEPLARHRCPPAGPGRSRRRRGRSPVPGRRAGRRPRTAAA